jgi:hypothetical protein
LLLDSGHKNWFLTTIILAVAAVGVYFLIAWWTPGPLTGGSIVGLTYGVAGAALMIFAGLLSVLRTRWALALWFLGPRKIWLKAHVWLGLLSGVLVLCHSGFRFGGPLEQVLMVVVILVVVTGVLGLLLQQFLPQLLASRVPREAAFEQIPRLCELLQRNADDLAKKVREDKTLDPRITRRFDEFYTSKVRPFLTASYRASSPLARSGEAASIFDHLRTVPGFSTVAGPLDQLESYVNERRQYAEQQFLHYLLHGWLLIHVPLSVVLLVLGLAHAFWSLYY